MDWSEEGINEEEEPTLRRRRARLRSPPRGRPLPLPLPPGSRSLSPRRGGLAAFSGSRSPSPRRVPMMAMRMGSSVRTTRKSTPPIRSGADAPAGNDGEDTGVKEMIAKMREGLPTSVPWDGTDTSDSGRGGGQGGGVNEEEEEGFVAFSFQEVVGPLVVDGEEVLDAFVGSDEARAGKAAAELLDATMGANTGPRTEAIKTELVVNRRLLDLAGLERWMRRAEAVSELEWFTGLCCDENNPPLQIDLFECAFRALDNASAVELHRGADARKRWIGPVGVPQFFICPISNKVMENPVVIASGKVR